MSPVDVRSALAAAELRRDWAAVRAQAMRATSRDPANDDGDAAYVALALDHAYQAFETLLVRVERTLGLPDRTGPAWHSELLAAAALPIAGVRPAIFAEKVLGDWDSLGGFRHFLRHAYSTDLDVERLRRHAAALAHATAATAAGVEALAAALDGPSRD